MEKAPEPSLLRILGRTTTAALGKRPQADVASQGALDPLLLRAGGKAVEARMEALLEQWSSGPDIFDLGQGVRRVWRR